MENQTPSSSSSYQSALGIDVCAERLDLCWLPSRSQSFVENSPAGIAELLRQLATLKPDIVVMEATGGLQRAAASTRRAGQDPPGFCCMGLPHRIGGSRPALQLLRRLNVAPQRYQVPQSQRREKRKGATRRGEKGSE